MNLQPLRVAAPLDIVGLETSAEPPRSSGPWLALLKGFSVAYAGCPVRLPLCAQRVMAFLALHDRSLQRGYVAGSLWPETTEVRAIANLRSTLWRLRQDCHLFIDVSGSQLGLARNVRVDVHDASVKARRLLDGDEAAIKSVLTASAQTLSDLSGDLLPDWYDDWVQVERERFLQLRLHALETLCERLAAIGKYAQAIEAGLAAVWGEPLRESAHRALIRTYLAEGNHSEAVRQYRHCRSLLAAELGLEPSSEMRELVGGFKAAMP